MDNYALMCLLIWPGVIVGCGLLNMLVGWTFSWSELIFDYLIGIVLGMVFMEGTKPNPTDVSKFFMVFSHGLPGLLHVLKVDHFVTRTDLFTSAAGVLAGAVLLAGLLDRATVAIDRSMNVGGGILSILIFALKAPWSLFTSSVGLLIWIAGLVWAIARNAQSVRDARIGFLGGLLYTEFSTGTGDPYATTLGCTTHAWKNNLSKALAHEMYHSRQYMYMRDWLIPFWLLGGLWGLISSKIAGDFSTHYFLAASGKGEYGNPIERAAYVIE